MRPYFKVLIMVLLFTGLGQENSAQSIRYYTPFSLPRNYNVKRYDTLQVNQCYSLDNNTTIGVIFRYWLVDMCVGVFKNNLNRELAAAFDTVNVTDSTRFYFYRSPIPSDGVIIIWESQYEFDSELRAYLFKNGTVKKMGKIDVDLDNSTIPNVSYPVSKIGIRTDGKKIQFTFKEPLKFRISQPMAPEDFYYMYDGVSQLIPVIKGKAAKPVW